MRLCFLVLALSACGTIANQPPPLMPGPPGERDVRVDGEWVWRLERTGDDGVERVETEHWHLRTRGDRIAGYYDRTIVFRAAAGAPFACNGRTEYSLRARYDVEGALDGAAVTLVEMQHETVPSPCERGDRRLGTYRGHIEGNRLTLRWAEGTQTLTRVGRPRPPAPLPTVDPEVSGHWTWTAELPERTETETWSLTETEVGTVEGSYERVVAGADCTTTARYAVRGRRRGRDVTLAETDVSVEADPADCDPSAGHRVLDSARGQSYGHSLVLEWRGRKRQVLHR